MLEAWRRSSSPAGAFEANRANAARTGRLLAFDKDLVLLINVTMPLIVQIVAQHIDLLIDSLLALLFETKLLAFLFTPSVLLLQ